MMLAFLEGPEVVIVLVIVLLVFGGSKLPQLARSVGQAQREFQRAVRGDDEAAAPAGEGERPRPPVRGTADERSAEGHRSDDGGSISFS